MASPKGLYRSQGVVPPAVRVLLTLGPGTVGRVAGAGVSMRGCSARIDRCTSVTTDSRAVGRLPAATACEVAELLVMLL